MLQVELARVRKKKAGRVHLTVRVPEDGPVLTLCNQRFAAGDYQVVEVEPDCSNCRRRQSNPALISGHFFEQDAGSRLLELSLAEARRQRAQRAPGKQAPAAAPPPPRLRIAPEPEPEPERIGELEPAGLKRVSERLFRTPGGVLVRLGRDGRLEEVVHDGPVQVERVGSGRLRLKVGDLQIDLAVAPEPPLHARLGKLQR
ncbi:MAG TPA: hypothetical protein VK131_03105 [Candidatus Acidoferrales bacterium]|nr:hypothetical protein [Candidatus Acidoferrales bacterium]